MLEIPLFVLVLQIGFNAALNYRGYNRNPLIPSRLINSGQTRRLWDSDHYLPLSSRGLPNSDSEQTDSEYSSSEESSYRSALQQSLPYQRRNDYLKYKSRADNDVSLEYAPIGRNGPKYVDGLQSSSVSPQTDSNFRRSYLRHRPPNLRQGQNRKYYRKENDDLGLEVSSADSSSPEDVSLTEEGSSYLRSLKPFMMQPKRVKNRKYYRNGDNLSLEVSPIDKLDLDEDADKSLPISYADNLDESILLQSLFSRLQAPNERRTLEDYNNHGYDLRFLMPSPAKDIPDAYIDTVLLVTDDSKLDDITIVRPKLRSPGLSKNKYYNRRYNDVSSFELSSEDRLTLDDDISSNLSPFRGLKPRLRSHKLSNDSPSQKYKRKNNDNIGLESSLIDKLFPDDDNTGHLTVLRLSSLGDLKLESPQLSSRDQKQHNNRQINQRDFLRLSLSPNEELTLDEDMASDLSEIFSDSLDELNLVPVNLRSSGSPNNKYSRRENVDIPLNLSAKDEISTNEDNLSNLSVLRLGSLDNSNSETPLLSRNTNLRSRENNEALKKLFDDNAVRNLVPYHERRSNQPPNNSINEEKINNWKFSDEFSLDTLFNGKEKDYDDKMNLDDTLSLEPSLLRNPDEYLSTQQDTTDTLHLEFPWNNQLGPDNDINNNQPALRELKSQVRSHEPKDNVNDTGDILHLEFPWNDLLSPNEDKTDGLRSPTQLISHEQIDNPEDTSDILHLEFPWNDQLSPDDDKSSSLSTLPVFRTQSRSHKQKDSANDTNDTLHLEFPWNDQLSPDDDKSNNLSSLSGLISQLRSDEQEDNANKTIDTLHLEFPWNDQLSPNESRLRSQTDSLQDKDPKVYELKLEYPWNGKSRPDINTSSKKTASHSADPLYVHPLLRNQNIDPNYYRRSYQDSLNNEDAGLLENLKNRLTESYLRKSDRNLNENQSLRVLSIARQGLENDTDIFNDSDEGPSGFITLPLDRRPHPRLRTQSDDTSLYLGRRAATVPRPNDVVSLLSRAGDKTVRKTYNDTIIFPDN